VLLQRNQVLRQVRERRQPATALDPWTEQMLHWGTQILLQRLEMLDRVEERAATILPELSGMPNELSIRYRSTVCDEGQRRTLAGLAQSYEQQQQRVAAREIEQAVSLVGPHRDDFTFELDGVDLNAYGSRGQQRLAVLALKLAEADWMRAEVGELPVVLLDDVLSELDPERRRYVLQRVAAPEPTGQRQVWITTTDDTSFSADLATSAQRFQIDAGQVRRA
jgi:DNA replication and repair protein RecF